MNIVEKNLKIKQQWFENILSLFVKYLTQVSGVSFGNVKIYHNSVNKIILKLQSAVNRTSVMFYSLKNFTYINSVN